jgi:hypothetical protein
MATNFSVFLINMDLPEPKDDDFTPPDILMGDDPRDEAAEDETEECPDCDGSGVGPDDEQNCPTCGGCGYLEGVEDEDE